MGILSCFLLLSFFFPGFADPSEGNASSSLTGGGSLEACLEVGLEPCSCLKLCLGVLGVVGTVPWLQLLPLSELRLGKAPGSCRLNLLVGLVLTLKCELLP